MTNNSPRVIFKCKYLLSLKNRDNNQNSSKYKKKRLQDVDKMINYFSNEKKELIGMFEYYMGHTRGEHCNLVMENGEYATLDDIKQIKTDYKKYIENSNLWKGILSFEKDYLDNNIDIKTLEQRIAKHVIPKFLKYCGFKDKKKMSYVFSVHTNTNHPHIHFAFIEKKPNYKNGNNTVVYRRKGKITEDEQIYLKNLVELVIERERYYSPMLKKTNEDIDYLKSFFNPNEKVFALKNVDDIYLEEDILKLGGLVKEYRTINNQKSKRIKYNSIKNNKLGSEIKQLTNDIKNKLFKDTNSELYVSKKQIENDLKKLNDYFDKLSKNNNVDIIDVSDSLVDKKDKYINNYIYNSIINHALYKYNHISMTVKSRTNKDNITLDDLIQEIAYLNNNKNNYSDKQRRKQVLDNYFKGNDINLKFPSKYKLEKNLKSLNYEMEKAAQEFSKLFDYDNKR